jgi:hypothetical protein
VAAFILIKTVPLAGSEAARFIAAITGILLTMLVALVFTRVDQLALTWSRAARPAHPARVRPPV